MKLGLSFTNKLNTTKFMTTMTFILNESNYSQYIECPQSIILNNIENTVDFIIDDQIIQQISGNSSTWTGVQDKWFGDITTLSSGTKYRYYSTTTNRTITINCKQ